MKLTQEYVKNIFFYEPKTGVLKWRVRKAHRIKIGDIAGTPRRDSGHLRVRLDGRSEPVHRIAWLYCYGFLPQELDHRDGNPSNNKIENLRPATRAQNGWNSRKKKTGHLPKNIFQTRTGSYLVRISKLRKDHNKTLKTLAEAVSYAEVLRSKLHAEYGRS